jgi:hypothetical protein
MALLAERICRLERAALVNMRRASAVEADVCRRLGIDADGAALERLEVSASRIAGGRRTVEVVEIRRPEADGPVAMYGIKTPHGSEPWSAQRASALGLGPQVLDVSDDGVVLEEFLPARLNVRQRRVDPAEHEPFARCLAGLTRRLIALAEGEMLLHRDERPQHIFLLGQGGGIEVRLIDWGRADAWPPGRFPQWARHQFHWLYDRLSFHEPSIWRTFVSCLAAELPEPLGRPALAQGYLGFVADRTWSLGDALRRRFAVEFLEFSARCGRLELELGWFNDFIAAQADRRGEELAEAYERLASPHQNSWRKDVL